MILLTHWVNVKTVLAGVVRRVARLVTPVHSAAAARAKRLDLAIVSVSVKL